MRSTKVMSEQQSHDEVSDAAKSFSTEHTKDNFRHDGVFELWDSSSLTSPDNRIRFDPILIHTLSLLKYHRNIHRLSDEQIEPIPEQSGQKPKLFSLPLDDMNMTEDTLLDVLSKSVMLISAHIGFEGIENSAVMMLRYAVTNYLQKVWDTMSICDRRRVSGQNSAFACSFLQVLRILRIEDVKDIAEFYRRRILLRRDSVYSLCVREYEEIINEKTKRKHELVDVEKQNAANLQSTKRRKITED